MLEHYLYSEKEREAILNSMVVLIDTRERKNEHIISLYEKKKIPYKIQKLDAGDYSCYIPKNEELGIMRDWYFDKEIMIERKSSLTELAQNFTKLRSSFEKELAIAPPEKLLLIENSTYKKILAADYYQEYDPNKFIDRLFYYESKYGLNFIFIEDTNCVGHFIWKKLRAHVASSLHLPR